MSVGRDPYGALALMLMVGCVVLLVSPESAVKYTITCCFSYILIISVRREALTDGLYLFAGYTTAALVLYAIQLNSIPEYIGFSGGAGVGTDDCRFWAQINDIGNSGLTSDCRLLENRERLNFSKLIRFLAVGDIVHPLDVVPLAAIPLALIPICVERVTRLIGASRDAARLAFILAAICPFTLANGLVLVRDSWTAAGLIVALTTVLERRYVIALAALVLVFFIRGASGGLVAGAVAGIALVSVPSETRDPLDRFLRRAAIVCIGVIALGAVFVAVLPDLVAKGVGPMLFRQDFLMRFIGGTTPESTLFAIMSQPLPIRLPLGFMFFFGSPFLKPEAVFVDGVFVTRNLMSAIAFPFVFLYSVRYFVRGAISAVARRHGVAVMMFIVFFVLLLVISQSSLQLRHKTLVMPLFYVLVGYGAAYSTRFGRLFGAGVACSFAAVQLVFLFI